MNETHGLIHAKHMLYQRAAPPFPLEYCPFLLNILFCITLSGGVAKLKSTMFNSSISETS